MGMQGDYTKDPCHFCLWKSTSDSVHYQKRVWSDRVEFKIGKPNGVVINRTASKYTKAAALYKIMLNEAICECSCTKF